MLYNFDRNQNHYYFNNKNSVPIIFIHGLGLNQSMWKPQIDFFKNKSFVTYDLLGHGKTPFSENILTMKKLAGQLLVLIENLKIDKFHLIGFSIGALVSIEFATNYEKYLNSLTLISTTYKRSNDVLSKQQANAFDCRIDVCRFSPNADESGHYFSGFGGNERI